MTAREEPRTEIWASDLARYTFCPEAERLSALGASENQSAKARMARGLEEHAAWQLREDARAAAATSKGRWRLQTVLVAIGLIFALVMLTVLILRGVMP